MTLDKTTSATVMANRETFNKVLEEKLKAAKSKNPVLKTVALSTEGWVSYLLEKEVEKLKNDNL